ncbi:Wd40 repeat protein, partial [Globisporangium splendens]
MAKLRVFTLFMALVTVPAHAASLARECESNADCSEGATCVAGDAETSVQRCVAGTPCGGSIIGSCPSDPSTGQLACIWRPDAKTCGSSTDGCKQIGGVYGIYKCLSLDRCDQYLGNAACSGGCNVNGLQCNGRGNCQVTYAADTPQFQCACDSGWNGTKCETVVDDSCVVGAGQCGAHGTCVRNACACSNGYTGVQCEIAPANATSSSGSGNGSLSGSLTGNSSGSNSSLSAPSSTSTTHTPNQANSAQSDTDQITSGSNGGGSKSTVFIVVGTLAGVIIVAALLFALYSRKKKREQEAAGGGFNRSDSIDEGVVPGGPDTPKGNIVIIRVDTSWLCGASHEMHLLREWVFAGDFGKARAFLKPLANVLTESEYAAALRVVETHQNMETLYGESMPLAHGHPGRRGEWNVHEARLQCFEDLVPFFRGEIEPEDDEYKYLVMPSEQLMCLLQDAATYNNRKLPATGAEPLDCISIAYEAHRRMPLSSERTRSSKCSRVYLLCETQDDKPPEAARNVLSKSTDWSRMRRRDDREDKVAAGRHAEVCGDPDIVHNARVTRFKNPLSMSLNGNRFMNVASRSRQLSSGDCSNNEELTIEEGENEDIPETEGGGTEAWLQPREQHEAFSLRTYCDAAAQTDTQSLQLPAGTTGDTIIAAEELSTSKRSIRANIGASGGATSPGLSTQRIEGASGAEPLSLEPQSRLTAFQSSYDNDLEQLDDGCDGADDEDDDASLPPSTCTSPITKYLEEEQKEDEDNADDDEEQSPDDPDEHGQLHEAASPFSEQAESSLVLHAAERYDQLTLDHIVRAAVAAGVKEAHAVRAIDISRDGSRVAIGTNARALRVFDLVVSLRQISPVTTRMSASQLSHATSFLPLLPVVMERHKHHQSAIYCIAYNHHAMERFGRSSGGGDGAAIASGAADSSIKVLSLVTNKETLIQTHTGKARALHFSAHNLLWSSCTGDLRIRCWDLEHLSSSSPSSCANLDGHVDEIQTFAFSKDDPGSSHPLALSSALDNTIRLWDPRSGGKCERIVAQTPHPAFTLQFHPLTSRYFASGHQDGSVALWDIRMKTRSSLESLTHHHDECRAISWSPDGVWLLSSSFDGTICVLQTNTSANNSLRAMASYHQHQDKVLQAQWHPTRPAIVTSGADKFVKLWTFS